MEHDSKFDEVVHPEYYADKSIEVIDYLEDTLTPEEYVGFCLGNTLKYVSRWHGKNGVEDLKKAHTYLNWAIMKLEAIHEKNIQGKTATENVRDFGKCCIYDDGNTSIKLNPGAV